jgi:hypothetical protein
VKRIRSIMTLHATTPDAIIGGEAKCQLFSWLMMSLAF